MRNGHMQNLGKTCLPVRRRNANPMRTYDALPVPLRRWLSQAVLPWSPKSAARLWAQARKKGLSVELTLQSLQNAERRTLASETHAIPQLTKTSP
ncbi:DUF6525 family protein [Ascidiaceihabitans sp.]|uniref:DUF6525 family protein n=1 Tax=Ascidiaceihabitans sp. TaxID=1872644 RepID=UPI003296DEB2